MKLSLVPSRQPFCHGSLSQDCEHCIFHTQHHPITISSFVTVWDMQNPKSYSRPKKASLVAGSPLKIRSLVCITVDAPALNLWPFPSLTPFSMLSPSSVLSHGGSGKNSSQMQGTVSGMAWERAVRIPSVDCWRDFSSPKLSPSRKTGLHRRRFCSPLHWMVLLKFWPAS